MILYPNGMKLIIGLGNPGKEYEHTRHNVGWDAVVGLAENLRAKFRTKKEWKAEVADAHLDGQKVALVLPLTFMNLSGEAVQKIAAFYKVAHENILIVHDEMDYPVGEAAFLKRGGPAGHNGVESVQQTLGTKDLARLRIGIGRPMAPIKKEDYVLQHFSADERKRALPAIEKAVRGSQTWIAEGIDKAMNTWNGV